MSRPPTKRSDRPGARPRELSATWTRSSPPRRRPARDAIHPGYGFLSENADFADACARPGVVFVGPAAGNARRWATRRSARRAWRAAGVPLVPGLRRRRPVGRGIRAPAAGASAFPCSSRRRRAAAARACAWSSARRGPRPSRSTRRQREAQRAFGDDRVLLERYLPTAAPRRGPGLRRQRRATSSISSSATARSSAATRSSIEEAPAPGLTHDLRSAHGRGRGRVGARRRLCRRRHGGISGRPDGHVLLHGDEHPPSGRASGDRSDHRPRPRGMAARVAAGEPLPLARTSVTSQRPCDRGAAVRRRPGQAASCRRPASIIWRFAGRTGRPASASIPASRRRHGHDPLRSDDRQADRRTAATARGRRPAARALDATRRIGGVDNQPRFLSRSLAHPAFLAGGHRHRLPRRGIATTCCGRRNRPH